MLFSTSQDRFGDSVQEVPFSTECVGKRVLDLVLLLYTVLQQSLPLCMPGALLHATEAKVWWSGMHFSHYFWYIELRQKNRTEKYCVGCKGHYIAPLRPNCKCCAGWMQPKSVLSLHPQMIIPEPLLQNDTAVAIEYYFWYVCVCHFYLIFINPFKSCFVTFLFPEIFKILTVASYRVIISYN